MSNNAWLRSFNCKEMNPAIGKGSKKKFDFFKEKVLNYGWVGVKGPKLVKM